MVLDPKKNSWNNYKTFFLKTTEEAANDNKGVLNTIPKDMMLKDMRVPTAPKRVMVIKLRKNCFFFTWNLVHSYEKHIKINEIMYMQYNKLVLCPHIHYSK